VGTISAEIYDLRGLNCPLPVLKTRKRLSGMVAGARIWIETTDPLAVIDVPAFCSENGHLLLKTETMEGGHRFLLEKG
jgi:tRNA 2-thiouridine synthesizing protein A